MHPKQNQMRVVGQLSLHSSVLFRPSNPAKDQKLDGQKEDSKRNSCISFSDFLDKKLHSSPVLPKPVKGKLRPFWSPLGPSDGDGSTYHPIEVKKEEKRSSNLDQLVFDQFKPTCVEKTDLVSIGDAGKGHIIGPFGEKRISSTSSGIGSSGDGEKEAASTNSFGKGSSHVSERRTSIVHDEHAGRKRRNPYAGGRRKHAKQKHSLGLGDHSKPNKKEREENFINNKKQKPFYNHYANGSGWWDCDMEGVDSEEVGFGQIWEGVGSVTFGGIEWH